MMSPQDLVRPDKPILFDGGNGTELMARGLPPGEAPEVWNLEYPGQVLAIHKAFVEAGSQVIETNTFGANAIRLRMTGSKASVKELIRAGCGLAKEAADGRALVVGSVGPLGEFIEPLGAVTIAEARAAYAEVVETMMSCGIDVVLVETMMSVDEALVALREALVAGASVVGVSMNYDNTPKGPRTAFGESPRDAVRRAEDEGAHIVGSNCGSGLDTMKIVARELVSVASVPVLIQANAGIPVVGADGLNYPEAPGAFATFVRDLTENGVRLVGGCCGASPEHIRQVRKMIR